MPLYADIVFPGPVRRCFTYSVPDNGEKKGLSIQPGMRVWVPLKNQMAIGMVVNIHANRPSFKTREIVRTLDNEPVLSKELLDLTDWTHRFFYAGLGETFQAALPAGMNFIAKQFVRLQKNENKPPTRGIEREIYDFLMDVPSGTDISVDDIADRWQNRGTRALDRLAHKNLVEIWQIPKIRMEPKMQAIWDWRNEIRQKLESDGVISLLADHYPKQRRALESGENAKLPKWISALIHLAGLPLPSTANEILGHPEITSYAWNRIKKTGFLESREIEIDRLSPSYPYEPHAIKELNTEQLEIFKPIKQAVGARTFKRFLLFGITGSGKTEIYIHALRETLRQGRGGLILIPEIALTQQIVRRFYRIFGDDIAVLHSQLSDRERFNEWSLLQKGEKRIVIGPRSAVFAPVHDPGLIIIDEEHDTSYKQEDPAPRYNAREVGVMRAFINNAVVLTGSATPSLVSLRAVSQKKAELLKLESRHADSVLPRVHVLDLKQYRSAMKGPLAVPLFKAIEEALSKKEQTILLLNRRGFSTFIQCNDCGSVVECPDCAVSLTYHKIKKKLRCHYCGYAQRLPSLCPNCKEKTIEERGMGTQKAEMELLEIFPSARILRMDQDTTSKKGSHEKILNAFSSGKADILMGTQIVAKGLDFPNVTVVGVISSDTELAFPSYRSSERMYQLLSQVAGRSGRGKKPGQVFLQTLMPDHPVFKFAKSHDFPGFAKEEMKSRRALAYPPFSRLVKILFKSSDPQLIAQVAEIFTGILCRTVPGFDVLGPSPSTIPRIKKFFLWESHLKLPTEKGGKFIERLFNLVFEIYEKEKPSQAGKVRIIINMDTLF